MKLVDILKQDKRIFSFEFFPPRSDAGAEELYKVIGELKSLSPDFVSITYGAFGSTQDNSLTWAQFIQKEIELNVMAHYTCIGLTADKIDAFLAELEACGIDNILALRGDPPKDMTLDEALGTSPFRNAVDLVRYIRNKTDAFSIGVAGYPEVHQEAPSRAVDMQRLKEKVDAGADFIITQLFFDNAHFYRFRDDARAIGITVPIIPGIMPLVSGKQIVKIASLCGASVPAEIIDYFQRTDVTNEEKRAFGIAYTIKQCRELIENNVKGLHFYTMNKSADMIEIFSGLKK